MAAVGLAREALEPSGTRSRAGDLGAALIRSLGMAVGADRVALRDLGRHRCLDGAECGHGDLNPRRGVTPERVADAEQLAAPGSVVQLHDVDGVADAAVGARARLRVME